MKKLLLLLVASGTIAFCQAMTQQSPTMTLVQEMTTLNERLNALYKLASSNRIDWDAPISAEVSNAWAGGTLKAVVEENIHDLQTLLNAIQYTDEQRAKIATTRARMAQYRDASHPTA